MGIRVVLKNGQVDHYPAGVDWEIDLVSPVTLTINDDDGMVLVEYQFDVVVSVSHYKEG